MTGAQIKPVLEQQFRQGGTRHGSCRSRRASRTRQTWPGRPGSASTQPDAGRRRRSIRPQTPGDREQLPRRRRGQLHRLQGGDEPLGGEIDLDALARYLAAQLAPSRRLGRRTTSRRLACRRSRPRSTAAGRAAVPGRYAVGIQLSRIPAAILQRSDDQRTTVETADAGIEAGVWTTGPDGELIPDYEATFPTINEGEVVHGTVVRVDKDEVLVDIGYKSEGVIPVAELSIRRNVNPADEVSLGDEVDALVMTKEDAEGRLILSKKRARFELAWKAIEAAAESGEPVNGRVIEVVKGGLILDLGVRGFLPGVARRHPPRAGPRRVPRQGAPLQGDRAQPLAEQRRALAPRRPRGRAQGDAPGDPRPAQPGRRRRGHRSRTSSTSAPSSTSTAWTA